MSLFNRQRLRNRIVRDVSPPVFSNPEPGDLEVTVAERAAYELLRGEPFPTDPTRADVLKARAAEAILQTERERDRIAWKQRRQRGRRGPR